MHIHWQLLNLKMKCRAVALLTLLWRGAASQSYTLVDNELLMPNIVYGQDSSFPGLSHTVRVSPATSPDQLFSVCGYDQCRLRIETLMINLDGCLFGTILGAHTKVLNRDINSFTCITSGDNRYGWRFQDSSFASVSPKSVGTMVDSSATVIKELQFFDASDISLRSSVESCDEAVSSGNFVKSSFPDVDQQTLTFIFHYLPSVTNSSKKVPNLTHVKLNGSQIDANQDPSGSSGTLEIDMVHKQTKTELLTAQVGVDRSERPNIGIYHRFVTDEMCDAYKAKLCSLTTDLVFSEGNDLNLQGDLVIGQNRITLTWTQPSTCAHINPKVENMSVTDSNGSSLSTDYYSQWVEESQYSASIVVEIKQEIPSVPKGSSVLAQFRITSDLKQSACVDGVTNNNPYCRDFTFTLTKSCHSSDIVSATANPLSITQKVEAPASSTQLIIDWTPSDMSISCRTLSMNIGVETTDTASQGVATLADQLQGYTISGTIEEDQNRVMIEVPTLTNSQGTASQGTYTWAISFTDSTGSASTDFDTTVTLTVPELCPAATKPALVDSYYESTYDYTKTVTLDLSAELFDIRESLSDACSLSFSCSIVQSPAAATIDLCSSSEGVVFDSSTGRMVISVTDPFALLSSSTISSGIDLANVEFILQITANVPGNNSETKSATARRKIAFVYDCSFDNLTIDPEFTLPTYPDLAFDLDEQSEPEELEFEPFGSPFQSPEIMTLCNFEWEYWLMAIGQTVFEMVQLQEEEEAMRIQRNWPIEVSQNVITYVDAVLLRGDEYVDEYYWWTYFMISYTQEEVGQGGQGEGGEQGEGGNELPQLGQGVDTSGYTYSLSGSRSGGGQTIKVIDLGEIKDAEGDSFTVELDTEPAASFITLERGEESAYAVLVDLSSADAVAGATSVTLTITEAQNGKPPREKQVIFNVKLEEEPTPGEEDVKTKPFGSWTPPVGATEEDIKRYEDEIKAMLAFNAGISKPKIDKISASGLLSLKLDKTRFREPEFDRRRLESSQETTQTGNGGPKVIQGKPAAGSTEIAGFKVEYLAVSEFADVDKLAFTYQVDTFNSEELAVQFNFENPYEVSAGGEPDLLRVKLDYFRDPDGGLVYDRLTTTGELPLQTSPWAANLVDKAGKATASVVGASTTLNIVLNYALSGGLQNMLSVIKNLQVIVHLNLLSVLKPPITEQYFKQLFEILAFDPVDIEDPVREFFDLPSSGEQQGDEKDKEKQDEPEPEPELKLEDESESESESESEGHSKAVEDGPTIDLVRDDHFEDLGYESSYMIVNLGSLLLIIAVQIVVIVLHTCSSLTPFCPRKLRLHSLRSLDACCCNGMLAFLDGTFVVMIMCGTLNVVRLSEGVISVLNSSFWVSLAALFFCTVEVVFCWWLIQRLFKKDQLDQPRHTRRFGYLYENLNYKVRGQWALAFPFCDQLRFVVLVVCIFVLEGYLVVQVLIVSLSTIAIMTILGTQHPYRELRQNYSVIFSESATLFILDLMMIASDPSLTGLQRQFLGQAILFVLSLSIVLSQGSLIASSIRGLIRGCQLRHKRASNRRIFEKRAKARAAIADLVVDDNLSRPNRVGARANDWPADPVASPQQPNQRRLGKQMGRRQLASRNNQNSSQLLVDDQYGKLHIDPPRVQNLAHRQLKISQQSTENLIELSSPMKLLPSLDKPKECFGCSQMQRTCIVCALDIIEDQTVKSILQNQSDQGGVNETLVAHESVAEL